MSSESGPQTSKLPLEILNKITELLRPDSDRKTLVNLCLVRNFTLAAQRNLYRRVAFLDYFDKQRLGYKSYVDEGDEEDTFDWASRKNKLYPFLTIVSTPNFPVAAQIQEFSCNLDSKINDWALLDRALRQMLDLKCLRVAITRDVNVVKEDLLKGYPFQLKRLCWLDYRRESHFEMDTYASFISSQTHIEYLQFATHLTWRLEGHIQIKCPNLQTFVGDFHQVHHFLPSIPSATTLSVYTFGEHKVNRQSLRLISPTFSNLRVLVFYPWFLRQSDLKIMVSCLSKSLEILHIVVREFGIMSDYATDAMDIFPFVPLLKKLQKFIWSCHPIKNVFGQRGLFFMEEQKEIIEPWFQTMPNLKAVYFSIFPARNAYARWLAGKEFEEPDEVSLDDFRHDTPFPDVTVDRRLTFEV